jgi:hypothetical protein
MTIPNFQIDPETLSQISTMKSADMIELVVTVGYAASLNDELRKSNADKLLIASQMMYYARTLMEQCGCNLFVSIDHQNWTEPVTYETE